MHDLADLHMHSVHSDGVCTPAELVAEIVRVGLGAVSLTDHDTVAGWPEFRDGCAAAHVEAIPGVELSGTLRERDAHILGYWIDPVAPVLTEALERFRARRIDRGREMTERLNQLGVPIRFDQVLESAGRGVVGRPHVADALLRSGAIASYDEAFRRYLGVGSPAYVPKEVLNAREAVDLIHAAGGLAVLAHPANHFDRATIRSLADAGLDGLEVVHPRHTVATTRVLSEIADENGLFVTGGSDYHGGERGEARIGFPSIRLGWVTAMKERTNDV